MTAVLIIIGAGIPLGMLASVLAFMNEPPVPVAEEEDR
jgi:hypothetical protein